MFYCFQSLAVSTRVHTMRHKYSHFDGRSFGYCVPGSAPDEEIGVALSRQKVRLLPCVLFLRKWNSINTCLKSNVFVKEKRLTFAAQTRIK